MRIRIHHETAYTYQQPAQSVLQILRLTPRDHDGQYVRRWRIDLDHGGTLRAREDAFGNVIHVLSADGSFAEFSLAVDGEVETQDTAGIVRGAVERFPPALYLRETPLTKADASIRDFAREAAGRSKNGTLDRLHRILVELHDRMSFEVGATDSGTSAVEAFARGRGVCQDLTHVFIAAGRALGIPSRYVGGHLLRSDDATVQEAGHAWAEAYVDDLGWVGFDPVNGLSPTDAYVRVGIGLDYLSAAPVRGVQSGGSAEKLAVLVTVDQAAQQQQT
ncbi:MAG TPA: transglutaminase family protein [Candidatus Binatia bacterium]|nr:transglutaminase family protein [Candidatus Binatia bacterium]